MQVIYGVLGGTGFAIFLVGVYCLYRDFRRGTGTPASQLSPVGSGTGSSTSQTPRQPNITIRVTESDPNTKTRQAGGSTRD